MPIPLPLPKYSTIEGFENLSAQEVFDMSVNHLRKQGEQALDFFDGRCNYRAKQSDGRVLMCAAGIFLRNDLAPFCERKSWIALVENKRVPQMHSDLITQLQQTHDSYQTVQWEGEFALTAEAYGLVYTPPKEISE